MQDVDPPDATGADADDDADAGSEADSEVYEVSHIVDMRRTPDGTTEYLIKWVGWGAQHNSWEPREHIMDDDLIASFEAKLEAKASRRQRRRAGRRPTQRPAREARLPRRPSLRAAVPGGRRTAVGQEGDVPRKTPEAERKAGGKGRGAMGDDEEEDEEEEVEFVGQKGHGGAAVSPPSKSQPAGERDAALAAEFVDEWLSKYSQRDLAQPPASPSPLAASAYQNNKMASEASLRNFEGRLRAALEKLRNELADGSAVHPALKLKARNRNSAAGSATAAGGRKARGKAAAEGGGSTRTRTRQALPPTRAAAQEQGCKRRAGRPGEGGGGGGGGGEGKDGEESEAVRLLARRKRRSRSTRRTRRARATAASRASSRRPLSRARASATRSGCSSSGTPSRTRATRGNSRRICTRRPWRSTTGSIACPSCCRT